MYQNYVVYEINLLLVTMIDMNILNQFQILFVHFHEQYYKLKIVYQLRHTNTSF